jgi:hypothetical protein
LLSDFGELILYLGLYINIELFPSVSELSGFPIPLDIFRVRLAIMGKVIGVLIQPLFDAGVIVLAAIGILLCPARIVFGFQGFFTDWLSTGLLPLSHPWVGDKGGPTITTLLLFHPGLPLEVITRIIQAKGRKRPRGMRRKKRFSFSPQE